MKKNWLSYLRRAILHSYGIVGLLYFFMAGYAVYIWEFGTAAFCLIVSFACGTYSEVKLMRGTK